MSISTMSEAERAWRDEQFGTWHNTGLDNTLLGYVCNGPVRHEKRWSLLPAVGIYDFRLYMNHPLTFVCGKRAAKVLGVPVGTMVQSSKRYETDKTSIPAPLHCAYERDRWLGAYPHDSGYEFGYLWVKLPGEEKWHKLIVTRWQMDKLLEIMVGAQDGNALDRSLIYHAVRLGGAFVWNPAGKAKARAARRAGCETVQPGADRPS